MKLYIVSKTTIFIRQDLAIRKNDNDIIDDYDIDGNDSNKFFMTKEKAMNYYNYLVKNSFVELKKLRSGFFYKLSRLTLDELDFDELQIKKDTINEENINYYSNYIFCNTTVYKNLAENRHNKKDLEKYIKEEK